MVSRLFAFVDFRHFRLIHTIQHVASLMLCMVLRPIIPQGTRKEYPYHGRAASQARWSMVDDHNSPGYPQGVPLPWTSRPRRLVHGRGTPMGGNFRTAVILSGAKDLRSARGEILRCAQDDSAPLRITALRSG